MKRIPQVKCILPFTTFLVNPHGYCYSCCAAWTRIGNVGRLGGQNSIMDIWNGPRMQYMRQMILEDKLERLCNFKNCPYAIQSKLIDLEAIKNKDDEIFNHALDQIMEGRTILDRAPHSIQIASSGRCNLNCIMCSWKNKYHTKRDQRFDADLLQRMLPEVLPEVSRLYLTLNGEVLFNPLSRRFLQTLDGERYPELRISLYTNGMLFTPALWKTISHNRYDSIFVSVDAASKTTYEKIRRNGNWDILQRNLEFIRQLRKQNHFYHFCLNYVVMKSNYHELKDFAELGLALGVDRMVFQKIFDSVDIGENINNTYNKKAFVEIAQILTDPVFEHPEADTTVIDGYRKYLGQKVYVWNRWLSKLIELALRYPLKALYAVSKHLSFPLDVREFFRQKRIKPPKLKENALWKR